MSLAMPAPVRALRLAQPPAPVCRLRRCAPSCVNARAASRGSLQCHRVAGEGKELSSTSASDNVRVDGLLGLDQICNDFECKSSPAIESTLRQCARDIDNLREGQSRSVAPFAEKVLYTDGLAARWTGRELGLRTYAPITTLLTSARSVVNSMRMDGLDAAYIGWSLSGQTPAGPVSLTCQTRLKLNLITGRVLELHDTWSFISPTPPQAVLLFTLQRLFYNLSQNARVAAANAAKVDESQSSEQPIYGDPTDPLKFFTMQDRTFEDGVQLMLVLAVMYTLVQGLKLTL